MEHAQSLLCHQRPCALIALKARELCPAAVGWCIPSIMHLSLERDELVSPGKTVQYAKGWLDQPWKMSFSFRIFCHWPSTLLHRHLFSWCGVRGFTLESWTLYWLQRTWCLENLEQYLRRKLLQVGALGDRFHKPAGADFCRGAACTLTVPLIPILLSLLQCLCSVCCQRRGQAMWLHREPPLAVLWTMACPGAGSRCKPCSVVRQQPGRGCASLVWCGPGRTVLPGHRTGEVSSLPSLCASLKSAGNTPGADAQY